MSDITETTTLRKRVHEVLEQSKHGDHFGRIVDICLIILIVANVIAVIMETVESVYLYFQTSFMVFEIVSLIIFTLEFGLRLWSSAENDDFKDPAKARIEYLKSPSAIIDILAIAPSFLSLIIPMDLRFLRVLRLIRLLKLTRYSTALNMLVDVIVRERNSFLACIFILSVLLVVAASGAYIVENQAQPENFGSIPAAMWWAVATLTTVGYGDVTPVTAMGKFFGAFITIIGIGVAALPAGILASGLAENLANRRSELEQKFYHFLEDGIIDIEEEEELENLRRDIGLSKEKSEEIRKKVEKSRHDAIECPHCKGSIPKDSIK